MSQIILSGVTLSELLLQIERLIDAKICVKHQEENKSTSAYLTRKEAASLLKITLPTLHDWTKLGYLKAYKMGSRVLYRESEVIATLEKVPSFKHKKGVYHG